MIYPVYLSWLQLMNYWQKKIKNKLIIAFILVLLSVSISAVFSLLKSVEVESLKEQKSLTPAFSLFTEELIKPLYIAETIAKASPLKVRMSESEINQRLIVEKLQQISQEFDMDFFVASEVSRLQYNSDGSTLSLEEEKVEWYFRAKEEKHAMVGALGNRKDIRIYYDIKVYGENGRFLGFIGVSRKLQSFLDSFNNFKREFGYDFVLADHNNNVLLSSEVTLNADGRRIVSLHDLSWYREMQDGAQEADKNNRVVTVDDEDFLIARAHIKALNWNLYLVNPLATRQTESSEAFIFRALNILLALLLALVFGRILSRHVQKEFAMKYQKDALTGLPNRARLNLEYNQVQSDVEDISVILVDIDHFKKVNDTFGHLTGDKVLSETAAAIKSFLRTEDIVARWGGEEFLIILPETRLSIACEVAERARRKIAANSIVFEDNLVSVTASFGVASTSTPVELDSLLAQADEALYRAKREGRNTFRAAKPLCESQNPGKLAVSL